MIAARRPDHRIRAPRTAFSAPARMTAIALFLSIGAAHAASIDVNTTHAHAPALTDTPTMTPTATADADGWTYCAAEGACDDSTAVCNFSGIKTVRYGVEGAFHYKTTTGPVSCNNCTFGDPMEMVAKHCDFHDSFTPTPTATGTGTNTPTGTPTSTPTSTITPPSTATPTTDVPGWRFCADENPSCSVESLCNFSGTKTVRYGADGVYYYASMAGPAACSNCAFQGDPVPGVAKHCEYYDSEVPQPLINLTQHAAQPGGTACLSGVLVSNGNLVTSTSNGVTFDLQRLIWDRCTINPAIGAGSAVGKQLVYGTIAPISVERLDVSEFDNENAIPDGPLFACELSLTPGFFGSMTLINRAIASDPLEHFLGTAGTNGRIIVTSCATDCDGDNVASLGELVLCIEKYLGQPLCDAANPARSCSVPDANGDHRVSLGELSDCVSTYLQDCEQE